MANNQFHGARSLVANDKPGYLGTRAYLCNVEDFDTIAAAPGGVGAAALIITGDHAFTSPAGFMQCYIMPHKHEGSGESQGEAGALSPIYRHKLFFPGDGAQLLQMLQSQRNIDMIFLAVDPSGVVFQLGDADVPANFEKHSFQSGVTNNGVKGYEVEIMAVTKYEYQGDITLATYS